MSKSNAYENAYLLLVFNNTNVANVGDATGLRGSSTAGNFYLSLHTSDPAEGGDQTTSEAAYTGYARVAVPRTSAGFTVSGNSVSLTSAVTFPTGSGGSGTATHFAVGTSSSGAGMVLYKGTISPSITLGNGIAPQLAVGTTITED